MKPVCQEPYRTKAILLWLDFESGIVRQAAGGPGAKAAKKDLKKLIR